MDRRDFLQTLAAMTAATIYGQNLLAQNATKNPPTDRLGQLLPQRRLGKTDEMVTMLGLGGWHIGKMSEAEAQKTIEAALAGGVRFFDNAESYYDGESEKRYGQFLTPKYRDVAFIMTKSTGKDAKTVRAHLEGSLSRLNTDYLDLWQIHSVVDPDDVDARLTNGVLEEVIKARDEGKVRYIGFTGHRHPSAHQRMLERTDILQTCQMPINAVDPSFESFIQNVLPTLVKRDMGVLAMKTLSNGGFFKKNPGGAIIPDHMTVLQALSFVWSLPVSVLITGPDDADMLEQNIAAAKSFVQMDETQREQLIAKVASLAGRSVEYYKRV